MAIAGASLITLSSREQARCQVEARAVPPLARWNGWFYAASDVVAGVEICRTSGTQPDILPLGTGGIALPSRTFELTFAPPGTSTVHRSWAPSSTGRGVHTRYEEAARLASELRRVRGSW
jgi:hypothetical protein